MESALLEDDLVVAGGFACGTLALLGKLLGKVLGAGEELRDIIGMWKAELEGLLMLSASMQ